MGVLRTCWDAHHRWPTPAARGILRSGTKDSRHSVRIPCYPESSGQGPSNARISRLEGHVGRRGTPAPFRAGPHDARIPLQGTQPFVAIGPFRRVLDGDVIERFATGAAVEQGARYVHHLR